MNPATGGSTFEEARNLVLGLFEDPRAAFLPDTGTLRDPRLDLTGVRGFRQVTDFQLLNLAAAHDAVLATYDAKLLTALAESDQRLIEVIP